VIKEAAIKKDEKVYVGRRHDKIILAQKKEFFNRGTNSVQGFVTDKGEFLTRKEAGAHAFECGQIKEFTDFLISEDLY